MEIRKSPPLSDTEDLLIRLVSVVIGVNIWLGLWMLFNLPHSFAVIGGFASYMVAHGLTDMCAKLPATRRMGESRESYVRRRIGEFQHELAELESKKTYRG